MKRTLLRAAAGALAVLGLACAASPSRPPIGGIRWNAATHVVVHHARQGQR